MTTTTNHTLDFTGFHPTMKSLAILATELGWTATQVRGSHKGKGGIRLHSPVTSKTVSIPQSKQMRHEAIRSMYKQVVTHSDQTDVDRVLSMVDVVLDDSIPDDIRHSLSNEFLPKAEAALTNGVPGDLLVSRRPWLATRSAGQYESKAVVEVLYNGEVHHYECAVPGCGYSHSDPQSVAAHYRRKKDDAHVHHLGQEPIVAPPRQAQSDGYVPSDRLVRLLAHALEEAGTTDFTELARAALTWAHDRPDLERETREPRELTAEEIVDRIRGLVSGDEVTRMRRELDTVTGMLVAHQQRVAQVEVEAEEFRRRAEKAEGDLASLVELAASLRSE